MALDIDRLRSDPVQLERAQHPFRARQAHHDHVGAADDQRRGEHRENHGGEQRLRQRGRQQARLRRERQQHEAELARLRQRQADA